MNEIKWPIKRSKLYYGYIIKTDRKEILKQHSIIFQIANNDAFHRNLQKAQDLNYVSPEYNIQYISSKEKRGEEVIGFHETYKNLDFLLQHFGFEDYLEKNDYIDMLQYLFNGKFAYDNCTEFGYDRKPAFIWKNGQTVANPAINQKEYFDINNYQLVEKNKITPYFSILAEVDYKNPEAIFMPFPEEGPIRKRRL